jgi:DNA-binding NarL/FixJ family response regulator
MRILLLRHAGGSMDRPATSSRIDRFADRLETLIPSLELEQASILDEALLSRIESRHFDITVLAQDLEVITADADFDEMLAALTQMRTTAPRVPVIYLAVSGNEWLAAAAIKYGASDYLPLDLLEDHVIARSIKEGLAGGRLPTGPRAEKDQGAKSAAIPSKSASMGFKTRSRASLSVGGPGRASSRGLEDGPDIPGYRLVRVVGEGGTATTYLALDERTQRHVVIKFMNYMDSLGSLDNARVFQREYDVIAGMNDRRVVKVYDSGVRDDGAYLVVEYFPGGDLGRRMRRPITTRDALGYARQIAQALRLIHSHTIFHRDLKPGNVMLREDGSVALIDFGLAKLPVGQTLAVSGRVLGTPSYLSPEQATGAPVNARSDIYSLGCVLFEMLSGERPYNADSAIRMIDKHVRAPIPTLPDEIAQLQPLIERTMAKKPQDRFQSAEAVIEAIDEVLRELPIESAAG